MAWGLVHFASLETVGGRTGQPRQTCVGNGLIGDTFWVIAAHGWQADWVRNIGKEPGVGYVTEPGFDEPANASIIDPEGKGPAIGFLRVPEGK